MTMDFGGLSEEYSNRPEPQILNILGLFLKSLAIIF